MIVVHTVQAVMPWFDGMYHWFDGIPLWQSHVSPDLMVVANQIKQTDLVGDIQKAFDHFVKTGQAWAFLIGLVLGYMVKTFTSFG
jgi:hypothetical protein